MQWFQSQLHCELSTIIDLTHSKNRTSQIGCNSTAYEDPIDEVHSKVPITDGIPYPSHQLRLEFASQVYASRIKSKRKDSIRDAKKHTSDVQCKNWNDKTLGGVLVWQCHTVAQVKDCTLRTWRRLKTIAKVLSARIWYRWISPRCRWLPVGPQETTTSEMSELLKSRPWNRIPDWSFRNASCCGDALCHDLIHTVRTNPFTVRSIRFWVPVEAVTGDVTRTPTNDLCMTATVDELDVVKACINQFFLMLPIRLIQSEGTSRSS